MSQSLVVGVDVSTNSVKAIAWDTGGRAVADGWASYPLIRPGPNWYEQDAEQWWRGTCAALRQLNTQIDSSCIDALCVTHQRESFVPVAEDACPIRNAILWLDERCTAQVAYLREVIGAEEFHRITGKPLTTNPSLPKMVWLMHHEPDVVARTCKFLDTHAFLAYRLTGHLRTSVASADPMGVVDMRAGGWAVEILQELGLRVEQFPELVAPGTVLGYVTEHAAASTGLPVGLPVVAGAGDGQCAGLGVNAIGSGRASLNMGTAVVSGILAPEYTTDESFRTLCAPVAGQYFLETVIQSGVFMVNWFVEQLAGDLKDCRLSLSPEELLEAAAAKVPAGSLGLMLVPYWNHAMTPYWDPAARGVTIGWTGAHGREHLYRAILEGIAFEQRLLGEGRKTATSGDLTEYVVMGGGSKSDLWCQILADVTGVPIIRSSTTEATCLGAGIAAATAAHWYPDASSAAASMTHMAEQFLPDPDHGEIYDLLYREVYVSLFPSLQSLIHRLTELSHGDQAK